MAELYEAAGARQHRDQGRPDVVPRRQDRGPEQARRLPPGPRVQRRPPAHRPALLHEFRVAQVHSERGPGEGRVRDVREALREVMLRRTTSADGRRCDKTAVGGIDCRFYSYCTLTFLFM